MALKICSLKRHVVGDIFSKIHQLHLQRVLEVDVQAAGSNLRKKAELYQDYLLQDPGHSGTRTTLAGILFEQGHVPGAAAEAEMALKDDPTNTEALRLLIKCYRKLGRKDDADVAQKALDKMEGGSRGS